MEPEPVADGLRGGFGGVEEVPAGGYAVDAEEVWGGAECEEVDAAEDGVGEGQEEDGGGGHCGGW